MEETARRSEFKDDLSIDAPIPGQSLTAPLGDRPWQNPPEYVEVEDALEYYIPKVLDPEFSVELLDIIEMYPIDVRILGEEYRTKDFTGKDECRNRGIELYFNKRDHRFSTSDLRKRVCDRDTIQR